MSVLPLVGRNVEKFFALGVAVLLGLLVLSLIVLLAMAFLDHVRYNGRALPSPSTVEGDGRTVLEEDSSQEEASVFQVDDAFTLDPEGDREAETYLQDILQIDKTPSGGKGRFGRKLRK